MKGKIAVSYTHLRNNSRTHRRGASSRRLFKGTTPMEESGQKGFGSPGCFASFFVLDVLQWGKRTVSEKIGFSRSFLKK